MPGGQGGRGGGGRGGGGQSLKIGVVADSHDNCPAIEEAVRYLQGRGVETLLHAGDIISPFAAKRLAAFAGTVTAVFGNNDGERHGLSHVLADIAPPPRTLNVGGRTIVLTHERERVSEEMLDGADLVIFGHDHEARVVECEGGGPVELNPGELGGWLSDKRTLAVVELDTMEIEIVEL